jgi:hypothetical protein
LATSTTITFTSASGNTITGGPFVVTWTPGPLDHFAVSVTGTTSQAVLTSTNVQVTAQDAFNNTITGFTGAVTQSFTTNGSGGPAALGAFSSVPASPYTFLVGDNGVKTFAITDDLAESNVTVNVSSGGKVGSANANISWTKAAVQTFAFTPVSLLTTATNQQFMVMSFKTSSRLLSGDSVTLTFPDDTDLSVANTQLGGNWGTPTINAAAKTVTVVRSGAAVPGNTTLTTSGPDQLNVTGVNAPTVTGSRPFTIQTTRDNALSTNFTVNGAPLTNLTDTPSTLAAGAPGVTHTIDFNTSSTLPKDGKIVITFSDNGFDVLTGPASINAATGLLGVDGGFTAAFTNGPPVKVTITRDGTGTDTPPTRIEISIDNVVNTSNTAPPFTVGVDTQTNGGTIIDGNGGPPPNVPTNSAPVTLTSVSLQNVTAGPTPAANATVGTTTDYNFQFTDPTGVNFSKTDKLLIVLPAGFSATSPALVSWTGLGSSPNPAPSVTYSIATNTITVQRNNDNKSSISAGTLNIIRISGIVNTSAPGSYTVTLTHESNGGSIRAGPTNSSPFNITGANLSNVTDSPANLGTGNSSTHTITFTNNANIPNNGTLIITYPVVGAPANFVLGGFATATWKTGATTRASSGVVSGAANNIITFTNTSGSTINAGTLNTVTLPTTTNSTTVGAYTITAATQDNLGGALEGPTNSTPPFNVTGQTLTGVTDTPTVTTTFASSQHTVAFTTKSDIPPDGKVTIGFPNGFDLTSIGAVTWKQNGSNISGTFATTVAGQSVILSRNNDGTTLFVANGGMSIAIPGVKNSGAVATNWTVTVSTATGTGATLDAPTASGTFSTTGQTITGVAITFNPNTTQTTSTHTVTFLTHSILPKNGNVVIQYPAGVDFNLSGVNTAGTTWAGIDGTFTVAVDNVNKKVTLTRNSDGTDTGPVTNTITFTNVVNTTGKATYVVTVADFNGAAAIDAAGSSAATAISGGTVTGVVVGSPLSSQAGSTQTFDVSFTAQSQLPSNGKIVLTFPAGTTFNSGGATTVSVTTIPTFVVGGTPGNLTGATINTSSPPSIAITNVNGALNAGSYHIQLTNVKDPTATGSDTLTVATTDAASATVDAAGTSGTFTINGGALTGALTDVLGSQKTATSTTHTISFTTLSDLPNNASLLITWPAGFDLTGINLAGVTWGGVGTPFNRSVSGQTLTLTRTGGSTVGGGTAMTVAVPSVKNTTVTGSTFTLSLTTQTGTGATIDGPTLTNTFTIFGQQLPPPSVTDTPTDPSASANTTHTVTFNTLSTIPPGGVVEITFPAAFNVATANVTNWAGGTGASPQFSIAGQVITLTNPIGGSPIGPVSHSITIAGIINGPVGSYQITVDTATTSGGAVIDGNSASPPNGPQSSTSFSIVTIALTNVTATPTNNKVGATNVTYTVTFSNPSVALSGGDTVVVTFPSGLGFSFGAVGLSSWNWQQGLSSGSVTATPTPFANGVTFTVSSGAPSLPPKNATNTIVFTGVTNTTTASSNYTVTVQQNTGGTNDGGPTQSNPPFAITGQALNNVKDNPITPNITGALASHTVLFDTTSSVPNGGSAQIDFPAGFTVSTAGITWTSAGSPVTATFTTKPDGQNPPGTLLVCTINQVAGIGNSSSNIITVPNVTNSTAVGAYTIQAATLDAGSNPIDGPTASTPWNIVGQPLTGATDTLAQKTTFAFTTHTFAFTTRSQIPPTGKVVISVPASFDLSVIGSATWLENGSPLNGSYSVQTTQTAVTITRNGTVPLPPGNMSIALPNVHNSGFVQQWSVGGQTNVTIVTQDGSGGTIDGPTAVAPFNTTGQTITSVGFAINPSPTQVSSSHTITFNTASFLPLNGQLTIQYPPGIDFLLGSLTIGAWNGISGGFTTTIDDVNKLVTLKRVGNGTDTAPTTMSVVLNNVVNASTQGNYTVTVSDQDVGGNPIDAPGTSSPAAVTNAGFTIVSATLFGDGNGNINKARFVFSLGADLTTTRTAAGDFALNLTKGGQILQTLTGVSAVVQKTISANDTLDVTFGGTLTGTNITGVTLVYTRPTSNGLRSDPTFGGQLLPTTTLPSPPVLVYDMAAPVLIGAAPEDTTGSGNFNVLHFTFSESVGFNSGAGFSKSGFDASQSTTSSVNDGFNISIDGETPQTLLIGGQSTGTGVVSTLTAFVNGLVAQSSLKQRAYSNFAASYDSLSGRYVLRSGVGIAFDPVQNRYVLDWAHSSVVVTPIGGNAGASNLKLGVANAGVEQPGSGDAEPGMSASAPTPPPIITTAGGGANNVLQVSINGDTAQLVVLGPINDPNPNVRGAQIAQQIQSALRQVVSSAPALQPAYSQFSASYDPVRQALVLASGTTGPASTVVVTAGPANDATAGLKLGAAKGGQELAGNFARTIDPIDHLLVLSQDGSVNLLAGETNAAITINGARIDVQLAPSKIGHTMPRFAWFDNGDGGFLQDLASEPNVMAGVSNVNDLNDRFATVLLTGTSFVTSAGVTEFQPGTISLDAGQGIVPTPPGGSLAYQWIQVSNGDPALVAPTNPTSAGATLSNIVAPGTYHYELIVTVLDANGNPAPSALTDGNGKLFVPFTVIVATEPPVAITGPRIIAAVSAQLDGTRSFDPNGGALTYLWSAADSNGNALPATVFDDPTKAQPILTPTSYGTFTVTLYVAKAPALPDPTKAVSPSVASQNVTVTSGATTPPSAEPGLDQYVRFGTTITLDGSLSVSGLGTPGSPAAGLTYSWTVVSTPTPVTLSSAATKGPTFTPSAPGVYTFQLVVTDANGAQSSPRQINVVVIDDAGTPPRVPPAAEPRAEGLRREVFLAQAPKAAPTGVVLDDGTKATLSFFDEPSATTHPTPGQLQGLTSIAVFAGTSLFGTGYVQLPTGDEVTQLTLADGTNVPVVRFARVGDAVILDGSRSVSATSVVQTFAWSQKEGPTFLFTNRSGSVFTIVPPLPGSYVFSLAVTDGTNLSSTPKTLVVYVLPMGNDSQGPPVAVATAPTGATVGTTVKLDASGSVSHASAGALTYVWTQVDGPIATIMNPNQAVATFAAPLPGVYTFEVTVTDTNGVQDRATVSVGVSASTPVTVKAQAVTDQAIDPTKKSVTVTLSASGSGGSGKLAYSWTQTDGSPVVIDETSSADGSSPKLAISRPGHYAFAVEANDGSATSAPGSVAFDVTGGQDVALTSGGGTTSGGSSGGCVLVAGQGARGGFLPLALALAFVIVLRRRAR